MKSKKWRAGLAKAARGFLAKYGNAEERRRYTHTDTFGCPACLEEEKR